MSLVMAYPHHRHLFRPAARRRHQPQMNPDLNAAFANLNGALLDLNISRDQARDIYEEIPDPPKAHRTSRGTLNVCLNKIRKTKTKSRKQSLMF